MLEIGEGKVFIEFDGPTHFDSQENPTPKTQARNELNRAIAKKREREGRAEKVYFVTISYNEIQAKSRR